MSLKKGNLKFETKTERVKNISFHPSKPWVVVAMRSGVIELWDFNLKICLAKFQQHDGGVRGIDFHPQLPLFVSGGDDGLVKVWDYKQKRCLFTLRGHIDFIRTTFFHNQLPWILSACDDQTMRIWNYQSRVCINIITGHNHYVMCAQFHPDKNLIVSASLDSTIRIWDFTILKKKLTESKNLSAFIGIQIECIKALEGHQRGVNWVCFHPSQNLIASGSDDRKIKLWKYTNEVAWQHSTIQGHKNNISCVMFDKKTGYLISNSEDRTTRLWNIEMKTELSVCKRQGDRYWMLNQSKNGVLLGLGHDNGFQIFQINKEIVPHSMIDENLIIFAQGMKAFMYDVEKKNQKQQLYQHLPKLPTNSFFIDKIIVNQFNPSNFIVQVNQEGIKIYTIKVKQSYLNFPFIIRTYEALDTCFLSKQRVVILNSSNELTIVSAIDKQDKNKITLKLNNTFKIKSIFSGMQENILVFVTNNTIAQYDIKNQIILGELLLDQNTQVNCLITGYQKIAILCSHSIVVTDSDFNIIAKISEKFAIKSAFWNKEDLLIYTTTNHWKYSLMNGQTGLLKTLQKSIHLLKKTSQTKFLAFNDEEKVFEVEFLYSAQIDFKRAVLQKDWQRTKQLIKQAVQQNKKYLISYLVEKGLASIALDMVQNPEQKFSLAIQATNFQLAFQICNKINTPQYWKLLGDEALKQGIYEAYELANQKLKNLDKLNFLYSLQANTPKLEKMLKLVSKMDNSMLGFNVALFLNKHDEMQKILRDCGYEKLAALTQEAQREKSQHSELLKRLGSKRLQPCQPEGEPNFSNWSLKILNSEQQDLA